MICSIITWVAVFFLEIITHIFNSKVGIQVPSVWCILRRVMNNGRFETINMCYVSIRINLVWSGVGPTTGAIVLSKLLRFVFS